ncbi:hypothetical protein BRADI_3g18583v3 [Brachypodium distachyon]|uniref:Uncharacterized protein n=1 Tax=Brachypodium distachyon TaxID=15368 RepID=A0A2K2CY19_BRADI|nr:hypothetical protein BRADI_3g18583v3 [Brachypodium distachyon]PNT66923.1 hypothetical protein BRADI_3g18583v3 [Brachypodium distachyon]PNT66927.1 hypothetical protein BRADI_3g18583v3 [Brachypodium distachyon]PNT66928.1 hypothetical protein BRADI_3g18583v3 [Brachypodium distachyon]
MGKPSPPPGRWRPAGVARRARAWAAPARRRMCSCGPARGGGARGGGGRIGVNKPCPIEALYTAPCKICCKPVQI